MFDVSKPDATPRKLINSGRHNALGKQAKAGLEEGLRFACQDMNNQIREA